MTPPQQPGPRRDNADGLGRFSLDFPPWKCTVGISARESSGRIGRIAGRDDGGLSGIPSLGIALATRDGPPARAIFEVRGPDGKPIVGARVEPHFLNSHFGIVPDGLDSIIGAKTLTDLHGRAVMTAFFPDEIASIRILAEGYGQQDFSFRNQEPSTDVKTISLRPVGRLKGRLVGGPGRDPPSPAGRLASRRPAIEFGARLDKTSRLMTTVGLT